MVEVKPVNAIVYNQKLVDIKNVVAPPYDVITSDYCKKLYERDPYNIVRLILTEGENRYDDARKFYEKWLSENVLIKTDKPVILYMIQKYTTEHGKTIERKGFIARNKIEKFETKKILPHEYTMGGPKEDRLKLTRAINANLSQIFMVYEDKTMTVENLIAPKYINNRTPFIDVKDDNGVCHTVYLIDDEKDIALIQNTLENKTLLIADGHHRYETAMNYSAESTDPEAQYVMSYFTNSADDNLVIFPTHRIITKDISPKEIMDAVCKYYDITRLPFDTFNKLQIKKQFLDDIEESNKTRITTGLYLKGDSAFYILKLKDKMQNLIDAPDVLKKLDLTVLHELIITKELKFSKEEQMAQTGIKYIKQEYEAFDAIDNNKASASFIMAYPKMKDILDVSKEGYRMPQKSTYFYPKLLSGIAINPLHK